MFEIFKEIKEINELDPVTTPDLRLFKLYEEHGELTQALNILFGRKTSDLTPDQVDALILEETADTIQCLFSYMIELGIEMEMSPEEDQEKGIGIWFDSEGRGNWDKFIRVGDTNLMADFIKGLHNEINNISTVRDTPEFYKSFFTSFIIAINIANQRGISVEDIRQEIQKKNVKWMRLIEKRVVKQKKWG